MDAHLHEKSRGLAMGGLLFLPVFLWGLVMTLQHLPARHPAAPKKVVSTVAFQFYAPSRQVIPAPEQKHVPQAKPEKKAAPKAVAKKTAPVKKRVVKRHVQKRSRKAPVVKKAPPRPAPAVEATPVQAPATAAEAVRVSAPPPSVSTAVATPAPRAVTPAAAPPASIQQAITALVSAIERHKKYPRAARRGGYGGVVTLRIRLARSGEVLSCAVTKGSGRKNLDKAALKAALKLLHQRVTAQPLTEEIAVSVPVRFVVQ